jgi:hypothetical protein
LIIGRRKAGGGAVAEVDAVGVEEQYGGEKAVGGLAFGNPDERIEDGGKRRVVNDELEDFVLALEELLAAAGALSLFEIDVRERTVARSVHGVWLDAK